MKRKDVLLLAAVLLLAPGTIAREGGAQESGTPERAVEVEREWRTPQELRTPESVLYDSGRDRIYVSNIDGQPEAKDGNGFISRLGADGRIDELRWVEGLNAPKGLALNASGDRLFASDIDALVEIDAEQGRIVQRYPAEGARFLNDVAIDPQGRVYVSDSSAENSAVYRLEGDTLRRWLDGTQVARPNGLLATDNGLLIGNGDARLLRVAYDDGQARPLADLSGHIQGIDGIAAVEGRGWLVSDWTGNVLWVPAGGGTLGVGASTAGEAVSVLRAEEQQVNAADITLIPERNLLLVPTFADNRVTAWRLELPEGEEEQAER